MGVGICHSRRRAQELKRDSAGGRFGRGSECHTETDAKSSTTAKLQVYICYKKYQLFLYPMFNIPIFQPGINKSNHLRMNLSNLRRFLKKILETILVIMMNTIWGKKVKNQINFLNSFFKQGNDVLGMSLKGRSMVSSRSSASSLCGVSGLHGSTGSFQFRPKCPRS